jgi:hypothetical protein
VGAGQVVVPVLRVPPSSSEGGDMEEVREWAAQCHGMTPTFPHSTCTTPGMATKGGLVEQRWDMIPRRCQRVGLVEIRL